MLLDALRREAPADPVPETRSADAGPLPPHQPAPPAGRGIAVTARDLRKSFDGHAVIEGLDLYLPAGGFTAVVGR
ncbi:ABC transporter ATP-binding protein, partial [Halomicrobium sp. IBSBa]